MPMLGQVRLVGETLLRTLTGRDDQQRGETLVVAPEGVRIPIPVVRGQLDGVLGWLFRATVVLEEKAKARRPASVAAIALRAEATTRAGRGRTPFKEGVAATAAGHLDCGRCEPDKERIGPQCVLQLAKEAAAAAAEGTPRDSMSSAGNPGGTSSRRAASRRPVSESSTSPRRWSRFRATGV